MVVGWGGRIGGGGVGVVVGRVWVVGWVVVGWWSGYGWWWGVKWWRGGEWCDYLSNQIQILKNCHFGVKENHCRFNEGLEV